MRLFGTHGPEPDAGKSASLPGGKVDAAHCDICDTLPVNPVHGPPKCGQSMVGRITHLVGQRDLL